VSFAFLDSTARTAWGNGTSQTGQLTAFRALWSGDVSVRYYTSGGTHLGTATHSGWDAIDTGTTPYSVTLAGRPAPWSHLADGTAAYCIVAVPGGADIIRADVTLAAAVSANTGIVNLDNAAGAAGLRINATASLPAADEPAWRSGLAVHQAVELASTNIRAGSGTRLSYSGLANRDTLLVLAACGGHNDSSDNGVDSLDLSADAPAWTNRIAPSASVQTSVNYYADGKPSSHHTYTHHIWSPVRDRLVLHYHRSPWGSSGALDPTVSNSLNLDTWAWDAAGTVTESGSCVVQDADGYCYAKNGDFSVSEYDPIANTKTDLANFAGEVSHGQIAYDSSRGTFFACAWGDGQGGGTGRRLWRYAARFASQTAITFNSSAGATALDADTVVDCNLFYVAAADLFFYWTGATLYKITPNSGTTWDVEIVTTTGATLPTPSHAHARACYVTSLGGMAYLPSGTSNLFFVRLV
jgi:hypothetical protein